MTHYAEELAKLKDSLLAMASHAETAVSRAMRALVERDDALAQAVIDDDNILDQFEIEIDDTAIHLLAKAPLATELRLITEGMKISQNLERVGDEAARIARTVQRLINTGVSSRLRLPVSDVSFEANLATASLRRSLDAFARLDIQAAVEVIKADNEIDAEFDGLMRKLITYMMEDPRTISASIDLVFVAKAIERVGDHAKNLAEQVIYIVKGTDVRHNTPETVESIVK